VASKEKPFAADLTDFRGSRSLTGFWLIRVIREIRGEGLWLRFGDDE
jgi:hypothetical protein